MMIWVSFLTEATAAMAAMAHGAHDNRLQKNEQLYFFWENA